MSRLDELDILIRQKNGKVLASIPQLSLYAKADDVNAALVALNAKKEALAAELAEVGELDSLEIDDKPVTVRRGGTLTVASGGLGTFAIKAGIVAFVFAAAMIVSGIALQSKVDQVVHNIKEIKIGGAQFWERMEHELDRMADPSSDLPEAKKQKFLADIRVIAARWRPFVIELQSALANPQSPAPPAPQADPTANK